MRTQITLDAAGLLSEFGDVFPLERFATYKKLYVLEVMGSKHPLTSEVRQFVRDKDYHPSAVARTVGRLLPQPIASNVSRTFPKIFRKPWIAKLANRLL